MELSFFLAKVMGIVFLAFGVGGLMRPHMIRDAVRDFDHESFARMALGCMAIALGIGIILTHSIWEYSWRGVITVFGWLVFIKGGLYMYAPKSMHRFTKNYLGKEGTLRLFLFVIVILGAYLTYKGFGY